MKPRAYSRQKFSGELYKPVLKRTGDALTTSYYFAGNITFTVGLNVNSKVIILANQPYPMQSLIANIKDANGNLILDDQIWQINGLLPIMNAFNTIEEYRMGLIKYQGTI